MKTLYIAGGLAAALAVPVVGAVPASASTRATRAATTATAATTTTKTPVVVTPMARVRSYSGTVRSVIDGDSIRVRVNGRTREVRLIGVAASSGRACYAAQARRYANSKLDGRRVTLKTDPKHDQSDGSRLFAYVYVSGSLFNIKPIRAGYAKERWYGPSYRLRPEFKAAERQARSHHVGLWGHC
jgi:endonuclease YncB( thermonuclease family)